MSLVHTEKKWIAKGTLEHKVTQHCGTIVDHCYRLPIHSLCNFCQMNGSNRNSALGNQMFMLVDLNWVWKVARLSKKQSWIEIKKPSVSYTSLFLVWNNLRSCFSIIKFSVRISLSQRPFPTQSHCHFPLVFEPRPEYFT